MHNNPIANHGRSSLKYLEYLGLVIITIATLFAAGYDIIEMFNASRVTLGDLLMLFIYLEVLAMIGLYLESGKLPIRMPLYIGIVALARYLVLDIKVMDSWRIIAVSSAILILAFAVLSIRYGHLKFSYDKK